MQKTHKILNVGLVQQFPTIQFDEWMYNPFLPANLQTVYVASVLDLTLVKITSFRHIYNVDPAFKLPIQNTNQQFTFPK